MYSRILDSVYKTLEKVIYKVRFHNSKNILVPFGEFQENCKIAVLPHLDVWSELTTKQKFTAFFSNAWPPKDFDFKPLAKITFLMEIFGGLGSIPDLLYDIALQRESSILQYKFLTESDREKAISLNSSAQMLLNKYKNFYSNPPYYLELEGEDGVDPEFLELLVNISSKFPIINLTYFVNVNCLFAFDEIRRVGFESADEAINLIYDILYIQQKISSSLFETVIYMKSVRKDKLDEKNYLIYDQIRLGKELEIIIINEKATIEKLIGLVSLLYTSKSATTKKGNDSKLKMLEKSIPERWKESEYSKFFFRHSNRDGYLSLEELRTNIVHLAGDERLQPHFFAKKSEEELLLLNIEIFTEVHKYHESNTMAIVSALAMVTDVLMELENKEMWDVRRKESTELMWSSIKYRNGRTLRDLENELKSKDRSTSN